MDAEKEGGAGRYYTASPGGEERICRPFTTCCLGLWERRRCGKWGEGGSEGSFGRVVMVTKPASRTVHARARIRLRRQGIKNLPFFLVISHVV